eukprot:GHVN01079866.1.p1 GENE.GHVN01079866.1~~GHVN01079866.1.p1  ORF type:complete len:410 (+),score=81.37 GHVN01079866.1:25-1230(+)
MGQPSLMVEDDGVHYHETLVSYFGGAYSVWGMALGQQLGIYPALLTSGEKGMTPSDIAAELGINSRFVLEWCRAQSASDLIEVVRPSEVRCRARVCEDPDEAQALTDKAANELFFRIPLSGRKMLSGEGPGGHLDLFKSLTSLTMMMSGMEEVVENNMRSGAAVGLDDMEVEDIKAFHELTAPFLRKGLLEAIESNAPELHERLQAEECKVCDVGCGSGEAVVSLAKKYKDAHFNGIDISQKSLDLAAAAKERFMEETGEDGERITFTEGIQGEDDECIQESAYDVVITTDALHDMSHPEVVLGAMKKMLKEDGILLIVEVNGSADPHGIGNLHRQVAPIFYTLSLMASLPSGKRDDGAALGIFGFHETKAREMLEEAGFTSVEKLETQTPLHAFYVVKHE